MPDTQKFLDNHGVETLWGNIKNTFVAKEAGKGLSTNDFTDELLTKLNGIEAGGEVNQNAFSNITVGATTIAAAGETDTFEIAAGSNVTLTPNASNKTITIAATDTTYSAVVADASDPGLMTGADKSKLDGIAAGAEVNQFAFSTVAVGATSPTNISADAKQDTVTFIAGSNVTLTGDATESTITIAATDTTYSDVVADQTGAAASGLMTSHDKYTLDNLVSTGGEPNVIEEVQVNGTALAVSSKAVNITVATGDTATGNIKVNGVNVTPYGLGTAAAATVETTGVASDTTTLPTTAQVKAYADGLITSTITDGDTTHAPSCDAVHDAIATAVASAYVFKGSVATASDLPASGNTVGDVYNITAASTYGPAGMNVAWTGSDWDALGSSITIDAMTDSEINAICV